MATSRRIPTSRLLVGILLHFCIPAYLLACLAAALLKEPVAAGWAEVPGRMLWTAAWFVPAFLAALTVAAGVGATIDGRRPAPRDEVASSRDALAEARRVFAGMPHAALDRALARLDTVRWDHADARHQRVAADLAAAAGTFAAAHGTATPAGRAGVLDLAADSVNRLADAMASYADEQRRLDEGDARTVAGYLRARYDAG